MVHISYSGTGMAVARRQSEAKLLHHTDRGSTYTSETYQVLLRQENMRVSMSRTADWYDNAAKKAYQSFLRPRTTFVDCGSRFCQRV